MNTNDKKTEKSKSEKSKTDTSSDKKSKNPASTFQKKQIEGRKKKDQYAGKSGKPTKFVPYKEREKKGDPMPSFNEDAIRLNKFLSNAGIASRREADVLIQTGVVSVNDEIILELGYKIKPGDVVKYDGQTINAETKRYVMKRKMDGGR